MGSQKDILLTKTKQGRRIGTTPLERFWEKVKKTPSCWIWTGAKDGNGYGMMSVHCRLMKAHRISWIIHRGDIPSLAWVLHFCDNPSCVNPAHLFLGTHQDNMTDMKNKGRGRGSGLWGSDVGTSKLTEKQIVEIRQKYASGNYLQKHLAKLYSVQRQTISKIVRGFLWPQVDAGVPLAEKHGCYIGIKRPCSKLTEEKVVEIRKIRREKRLPYRKLASQFGVSHKTIEDIIKRRKWKHV